MVVVVGSRCCYRLLMGRWQWLVYHILYFLYFTSILYKFMDCKYTSACYVWSWGRTTMLRNFFMLAFRFGVKVGYN